MATTHCFFSFPFTTRRNPLIIVSSKTAHRKNYLRPKILKTLTKSSPIIRHTLLQPPPLEHELYADLPADENTTGNVEETDESEELRVSVDTAKNNGFIGNVSAKDIFKYGSIYLVGAFVFQTVCYFWNLGNQRSKMNNDDLEVSETEKWNVLLNRNGKTVEDEIRMEKKIEEIKLLAREARRIELEKKGKEEENVDSEIDDESVVSSGIEKEIGERLLKLKNRINSKKDNLAAMRSNGRGNSAGDNGVNGNQGKEELVFKKNSKSKFKSPSIKGIKSPKDFSGTQERRVSSVKPQDYAGILDADKQVNQNDVPQKNISGVPSEERGKLVVDESREIQNDGKNLGEKSETPNMKTKDGFKTKSKNNGGFQETSVAISSPEVIPSGDSRELRTHNSHSFVEGKNQDTDPTYEKDSMHSINGSSGNGLAKKHSAANEVKVKQANNRPDMWWLNLRYVLVILMQRGSNGEGPKGLYNLQFTSKEQGQSDDSYTVAFEDQADANNFCFLLESFFEDLGDDVSANAVPMSIQELNEEMISHGEKVVVVKKRQLQLYAGQLLTDVEMALCSIIEQDQNMP